MSTATSGRSSTSLSISDQNASGSCRGTSGSTSRTRSGSSTAKLATSWPHSWAVRHSGWGAVQRQMPGAISSIAVSLPTHPGVNSERSKTKQRGASAEQAAELEPALDEAIDRGALDQGTHRGGEEGR